MKISENVLQELNSLDDLIKKMGCENPKLFKYRVEFFKHDLGVLFPDFTIEEIVKIYNNFDKFKQMFSNIDFDDIMTAIEFEQIKNKENEN